MTPHPEVTPLKDLPAKWRFDARLYSWGSEEFQRLMTCAHELESALASSAEPVEMDYVPGLLDQTCPPKIWLQIDTMGSNEDRSEAIPESAWGDLSWCYEPIGGQEVVYIRADLVAHAPPAVPVESLGRGADYPECSGDPASCPENEGQGSCKPNPVKTVASVPDGWRDIYSIPKDESRVELLAANGKTDVGNYYHIDNPSYGFMEHLNTDGGHGDYTHWRPLTTPEPHT